MKRYFRILLATALVAGCLPWKASAQNTPSPAPTAPAATPADPAPAPAAESATPKKKKPAKISKRKEIDKSIESGTVPARYRSSVPKEYQQYIPFEKR